jgi:hypothetical protein
MLAIRLSNVSYDIVADPLRISTSFAEINS